MLDRKNPFMANIECWIEITIFNFVDINILKICRKSHRSINPNRYMKNRTLLEKWFCFLIYNKILWIGIVTMTWTVDDSCLFTQSTSTKNHTWKDQKKDNQKRLAKEELDSRDKHHKIKPGIFHAQWQ